MTDESKRTVVVTGGAKGIGAAIARAAADAGHGVHITYRQSDAAASALLAELSERHPGQPFDASALDLADTSAVEGFAEQLGAMDGLYGLVHNAGATYDALAPMLNQDRAERLMQVNFWSLARLVKAAIRPMMRAKSGRVIAIGSVTATRGTKGNGPYAASKAAIEGYMRSLAIEVAPKGVTANVIAPGYVDTDMMAPYEKAREAVEACIPTGRYARPEEIAALARHLLSAEAAPITGAVLPIDGGLSAAIATNR